jgi:hypothetical protein
VPATAKHPAVQTSAAVVKGPALDDATEKAVGPGGLTVRLVSGKRLRIGYAVKEGVCSEPPVELWYTHDGKNWTKDKGPKQDHSPYVMEIKEEGLYGLMLVACTDKPSARPEPGDLPQFWVAVDWTRPEVSLLDAGFDADKQKLKVRWSATDLNLGPRPITISYAERITGPWTTLASSLPNKGSYEDPLPHAMPVRFYVRVEATDQVGNVGEAHTLTPVILDPSVAPAFRRPQITSIDYNDD